MALVCSRKIGNLYELMARAERQGATITCSEGTLFDWISKWTSHGCHFVSLNRSGPRQKDGCMIAISTKFARIRCVHHWMLGRILGLQLQCGEGRRAADVYVISAYAPVHDERTQTVASESLRRELWIILSGVIRQIREMCTTLPCRTRDRRQRWSKLGNEHRELMRANQLVASSTHGEANRQCWTWFSPFGNRHCMDYMIKRLKDADHRKVKVDNRMPVC